MFTFLLFYSRGLMKTSYGAQLPLLFSPFPSLPSLFLFFSSPFPPFLNSHLFPQSKGMGERSSSPRRF